MKITYTTKKFTPAHEAVIGKANEIIERYQADGLKLTLRQLYYRFVAAAAIPNTERSYKRLGGIIKDARLAGRIDWNAIEDRGRGLGYQFNYRDVGHVVESMSHVYHLDHWKGQARRVEVWVEKQALEGVVERACRPLDVDWFACKGYMSASEMWAAAMRFKRYSQNGQGVLMLHLGDHDPSGIDMTRDIDERTNEVFGVPVEVKRIALNMSQVEEFDPPPNPTKVTDSRAGGYMARYGDSSWELDALEPAYLDELITDAVWDECDRDLWDEAEEKQESDREKLQLASLHWDDISKVMADRDWVIE